MPVIDTPAARKYNVAEYFFDTNASQYIDLVEDAISHVFCDQKDHGTREAFSRYLSGEKIGFSRGICECLTAGFGECDDYGYWEFSLPMDFVNQFYGTK